MKTVLLFLFVCCSGALKAQDSLPRYPKRIALVGSGNGIIGGGSVLFLNAIWYKDYPKSKLHFFNDGSNWMQMDKVGHSYTAYQLCRAEQAAWTWAGVSNDRSAFLSAGIVWSYQFSVEVLDGLSEEWGFSVPDLVANTAGIGLFLGQQLGFKEQRIFLKYSYKSSPYSQIRPNTLGSTFPEKLLKDYNAQSYWLSFAPRYSGIGPDWPKWLQLSVGYSADAKLKGDANLYSVNGFTYKAEREWALSFDIDWSKLPVKKPWLRKTLGALNAVKVPFPAVFWRGGVCYVGLF